MYSSADVSVTPRPMYPADGRKLPDVYSMPAALRDELQARLGTFPLFDFWGPRASIASTRWIAEASKIVEEKFNPTLTLIYLPHLDYNLQRLGPGDPRGADRRPPGRRGVRAISSRSTKRAEPRSSSSPSTASATSRGPCTSIGRCGSTD